MVIAFQQHYKIERVADGTPNVHESNLSRWSIDHGRTLGIKSSQSVGTAFLSSRASLYLCLAMRPLVQFDFCHLFAITMALWFSRVGEQAFRRLISGVPHRLPKDRPTR
jgi:hypothetical protein